jgi:VCBS repeat-containing protein
LAIAPVNDAPVAKPDSATVDEDHHVGIDALTNDTDVDAGAKLSLVSASVTGGLGTATIVGNQLVYSPGSDYQYLKAGESANVVIDYTIADEQGAKATSVVNVLVTGAEDAPARIGVAVIGGDASTYADAAGQLDFTKFDAFAISSGKYADAVAWSTELDKYDVVVLGGSGTSPGTDYTQTSLFEALEQFVDGGGGVVTTGWFAQTLSSNIAWDSSTLVRADYITPISRAGFSYVGLNAEITVSDPTHAIVSGLAAYPYQSNAQYHVLALALDEDVGAINLATGSGGTAIAYDEFVGHGRTAYIGGTYMASGDYSPETTRAGVSDQILEQAVTWAAGGSSATVLGASPTSLESTALLLTGDEPQPADQFYFEDLPVTESQSSDADNIELEFAIAQVGNDPVEYQGDASEGTTTAVSWDFVDSDAYTGTAVTADVDLF